MTSLNRFYVIRLLAFSILLILPATSGAQQLPPLAEQMAKAASIRLGKSRESANLQFGSSGLTRSETWEWDPKIDRITYWGKDNEGKPIKLTYLRSQLSNQSDAIKNKIYPAFINDQYWLIFPFHVVCDGATVTDEGIQKLPLGEGSAELIRVKYGSGHGYTPGDTWELYLGPDKRVEEMVYRRGGKTKPSLVIVTWEDYRKPARCFFQPNITGPRTENPCTLHSRMFP